LAHEGNQLHTIRFLLVIIHKSLDKIRNGDGCFGGFIFGHGGKLFGCGGAHGNARLFKCHIVGLPKFHFIAFQIKDMDKFSVISGFHLVGYCYRVFAELYKQCIGVCHPVMEHKIFGGRQKVAVFFVEGAPLAWPFWVVPCRHANTAPYSLEFSTGWVWKHARTFLGALHLKKIPPMPVAFFSGGSPGGGVMSDLTA
jgi:hypothetical protein